MKIPATPTSAANPAIINGSRKYANDDSVKSAMWPSDNVYSSGFRVSADEISPGVGNAQTRQRSADVTRNASPTIIMSALVPLRTQIEFMLIADPISRANAGYVGIE